MTARKHKPFAPPEAGWQAIETAPKIEAKDILLWTGVQQIGAWFASWPYDARHPGAIGGAWVIGGGFVVHPTLWQPLPAPPATARNRHRERQMNNERAYYDALKRIASYMTPDQIRRDSDDSGLEYEEYLAMSYENILAEAKRATKGRRRPKPPATATPQGEE